jgi:hypothetical protein
VSSRKVRGVKDLNGGTPRLRVPLKKVDNVGDLIRASHMKKPRAICAVDSPAVVGFLSIARQIVSNEVELSCFGEVPE